MEAVSALWPDLLIKSEAELKQRYFELVLVQEPTDPVGETFEWYRAVDSILCANGMKP
jgi:hypothetical protein